MFHEIAVSLCLYSNIKILYTTRVCVPLYSGCLRVGFIGHADKTMEDQHSRILNKMYFTI